MLALLKEGAERRNTGSGADHDHRQAIVIRHSEDFVGGEEYAHFGFIIDQVGGSSRKVNG